MSAVILLASGCHDPPLNWDFEVVDATPEPPSVVAAPRDPEGSRRGVLRNWFMVVVGAACRPMCWWSRSMVQKMLRHCYWPARGTDSCCRWRQILVDVCGCCSAVFAIAFVDANFEIVARNRRPTLRIPYPAHGEG